MRELDVRLFGSVVSAIVAQSEREAGLNDAALHTLADILSETELNEHRWFDAEIHTLRGEILRKQSPRDPQRAEAAFLAAITLASAQGARSFELRAALRLAELYLAWGRFADARQALAPALRGFAPTAEFPEVAEAMALLSRAPS